VIVFFELINHSIHVGHVSSNEETGVASVELLVVNECVTSLLDLVTSPLCIGGVSEAVLETSEHANWRTAIVDVGEVNSWRCILSIFGLVGFG